MSAQFANSRGRRVRSERAKAALRAADPKFRQLLNARTMDFFLSSSAANVGVLVTRVFNDLRALGALKTRHNDERRQKHLEAILLNLFAAYDADPNRYVAIELGRNKYSERGR
jgi:hypothetical protein